MKRLFLILLGLVMAICMWYAVSTAQTITIPRHTSVTPPAELFLTDEFHTHSSSSVTIGQLGWLMRNVGGGTATGIPQVSTGSQIGIVRLGTSTTTDGHGGSFGWDATNVMFTNISAMPGPSEMLTRVSLVATTTVRFRWGYMPSGPAAEPTGGVYFRYDTKTGFEDTTWKLCRRSASDTEACVNTTVAVTTSYFNLRIYTTAATPTTWYGQVNNTTPVCMTTAGSGCGLNSTTFPTVALTPTYLIVNDNAGAARHVDIDWFALKVSGLSR